MSRNTGTGDVSLRKSSQSQLGKSDYNLSARKLVLFALLDTLCQLFLQRYGFYPANEISQSFYCFANHSKMSVLFAKNTKCLC